jgi:hypothetical protein
MKPWVWRASTGIRTGNLQLGQGTAGQCSDTVDQRSVCTRHFTRKSLSKM